MRKNQSAVCCRRGRTAVTCLSASGKTICGSRLSFCYFDGTIG